MTLGSTISSPSVSQLSKKCGSLDVTQPYRSPWSVTGIALPQWCEEEKTLNFVRYSLYDSEAQTSVHHDSKMPLRVKILHFIKSSGLLGAEHRGMHN
jgi:hypothetical protein